MSTALLRATGIRRVYKLPRTSLWGPRAEREALGGVDLAVESGASVGIVGESGSGKSVTAMTLMGLTRSPNARFAGSAKLRLASESRLMRSISGPRPNGGKHRPTQFSASP